MGFESLYIGSTGMKTHGTRMQNIGNNLANVSTLGYKGTNVHFETLFSEVLTAGADSVNQGLAQSGKGVGLSAVLTDYRTGGFMDGTTTTDLAISGKGFFQVVKDDVVRYTRAGNFRFDNEGFLVDPNGYRVQGKGIADGVAGTLGDIQLPIDENGEISIDPIATTTVSMGLSVGTLTDRTTSAANPYFSLLEAWNGTDADDTPLAESAYGYKNTIRIYDSEGTARDLDVYLDAVSVSNAGGKSYFEFVVGSSPSGEGLAGLMGTSGAGLALAGTMVFDSAGNLENVSAFSYDGDGDVKDLTNWLPASFGADGSLAVSMTFADATGTASNAAGAATTDFGLSFGLTASSWSNTVSNAAGVGHNQGLLPSMTSPTTAAFATVHYPGSSATVFQTQDGSPRGYLTSLNVDADGTLVGNYSNGLHEGLAQVSLFNFVNEWGLRREGANHFTATSASGDAVEGVAGTENFGSIAQNTLETSNVDMADQFAKMIITERGFQANSKVITTTDQILQVLYQLKR